MKPKWKAAAIWAALPYACLEVFVLATSLLQGQGFSYAKSFFDWQNQRIVLLPCLVASVLGTLVLWLLPIRREWLGILVALILSLLVVILCARIAMKLWGGFEENPGIFLMAVALAGPSCAAGAYAGFLRSRDQPDDAELDDDGWWPSPRS